MIDTYRRRQSSIAIAELFPDTNDGKCACGCGLDIPQNRRRWATDRCRYLASIQRSIIFGDTAVIRHELLKRDNGLCAHCGNRFTNLKEWQADHIIPVSAGGGGCTLDNFQTLCVRCHLEKTLRLGGAQKCDPK
jgi:5-methylcytosine-specific restriction endonuclease McrA